VAEPLADEPIDGHDHDDHDEPDPSGGRGGPDQATGDEPGAAHRLRELGSYIREQRGRAQYSLRHLARIAGVSNPYLSQIERGLRKPSAEILQAIAKALQISSETLYVKAGILEERRDVPDVEIAILRDESLNERQRAALVEVYRSFVRENQPRSEATPPRPTDRPGRSPGGGGRPPADGAGGPRPTDPGGDVSASA
jgi:transcriptional regulator with XRE-family HTH domain